MRWILLILALTFLPPFGMLVIFGQATQARLEQLMCYNETRQFDACDIKHGNVAERVIAQLRHQ